jgi:hypothetical protein
VQYRACRNEVRDDFYTAQAVCLNAVDEAAEDACDLVADAARAEGRDECVEQREARQSLCEELGPDRYNPNFDPVLFDTDFTNLTMPNPYFPLGIGDRWVFVGGAETVTIEVLNKTKLIEGVTCIVVNDLVEIGGQARENTDDWFGQAKDGTVYYCGESVRDFETFAGDNPMEAELVDIEGSFKAGRDGAEAGIQFLGAPTVGAVYRQEWSPGNAEDAARVLSTTYDYGDDPVLDQFVPEALADLLCANDCVVTGEFSPLEPDVLQHKYYAPGIGKFLEVDPESGELVQLVDCNVDPKCALLPAP